MPINCVPTSIIQRLRGAGHTVLRLRDHLPPDAPDAEVINYAQKRSAILISLNGDFADIVTYPPAEYQGIIALQIRNHPEVIPDLMNRVLSYFERFPDMQHYERKLLLVEVHRIRVRTSV